MALKTRLECIETYCSETENKIKEIQKEINEFNGYGSLDFIETRINNAIEHLNVAKENVMKAYDEVEK